jgi:hypothetical protein
LVSVAAGGVVAGEVAGGAVFGLVFGVWLVNPAVVLPAGGGFGASTIPLTGGGVEGVGSELSGTEFVAGIVETVGETLFGLPSTLFAGCGMLGGVDGGVDGAAGFLAWPAAAGVALAIGDEAGGAAPGSGISGSASVAS